jgi:hypothetical protein
MYLLITMTLGNELSNIQWTHRESFVLKQKVRADAKDDPDDRVEKSSVVFFLAGT